MSHTDTAGLPEPQASLRAYKEGKGEIVDSSEIDPGKPFIPQLSIAQESGSELLESIQQLLTADTTAGSGR